MKSPSRVKQHAPQPKKKDASQYLAHYKRLLWKKRWFILLIAPVVGLAAAGLMVWRGTLHPELETSVVFGLESPQQWGAVDEYADIGAYRIELIRSRSFLSEVAEQLSLQLVTESHGRDEVFDSVHVGAEAVSGSYVIDVPDENDGGTGAEGTYRLLWKPNEPNAKEHVIREGELTKKQILIRGASFTPSDDFLKDPHDVEFRIMSMDRAVDRIRNNMSVDRPTRTSPDHFKVSLTGRDYKLAATTLNTIADAFVEKNANLRKRTTKERLRVLETQLASAREQLDKSEGELRGFLSRNPSASLDQRVANTVDNIAVIQSSTQDLEQKLSQARALQTKYQREKSSNAAQVTGEIVAFLEAQGIASAAPLNTELDRLTTERTTLDREYMEGHPLIERNADKMNSVGMRAYSSLNDLVARWERDRDRGRERIAGLSQNLKALPRESMQLAELRRKQAINSEIFTNLQSRYNEAKVADATSMADIFLIDAAAAPIPPPLSSRMMKIIAFALIAAALLSIGPVLIMDYLDKTAATEFEVRQMTDMMVLESIPVIKRSKKAKAGRSALYEPA